jgi:hypothetical protein
MEYTMESLNLAEYYTEIASIQAPVIEVSGNSNSPPIYVIDNGVPESLVLLLTVFLITALAFLASRFTKGGFIIYLSAGLTLFFAALSAGLLRYEIYYSLMTFLLSVVFAMIFYKHWPFISRSNGNIVLKD